MSNEYIKLNLKNLFTAYSLEKEIDCVTISNVSYVALIHDSNKAELHKVLSNLPSSFDEYYVIISCDNTIHNVHDKFNHIRTLLLKGIISNTEKLIYDELIVIKETPQLGFSKTDEKILLYHVSHRNNDAYLKLVDKIVAIGMNTQTKSQSIEFLKSISMTINMLINNEALKDETFEALMQISDSTELYNKITSYFTIYYNQYNNENDTNDMRYKFLEYIKDNYDTDFSLTDMAEHFNLSMNYVGPLFKEKTGSTFKMYLNSYRINMAKQIMLDNPNIKIKELSTAVGFTTVNTFIRIFKEQEGISPGQYQKINHLAE